jgi:hypothetical protein
MTMTDFSDRPGAAPVLGASGELGPVLANLLADRGRRLVTGQKLDVGGGYGV